MYLGRVLAHKILASPILSIESLTGTATSFKCIPMSVPPISSPHAARICSTATGCSIRCQAAVANDPPALGFGTTQTGSYPYPIRRFFLQNQRTVQMLTALRRKKTLPWKQSPERSLHTAQGQHPCWSRIQSYFPPPHW